MKKLLVSTYSELIFFTIIYFICWEFRNKNKNVSYAHMGFEQLLHKILVWSTEGQILKGFVETKKKKQTVGF